MELVAFAGRGGVLHSAAFSSSALRRDGAKGGKRRTFFTLPSTVLLHLLAGSQSNCIDYERRLQADTHCPPSPDDEPRGLHCKADVTRTRLMASTAVSELSQRWLALGRAVSGKPRQGRQLAQL